jgi:hypothetical protein
MKIGGAQLAYGRAHFHGKFKCGLTIVLRQAQDERIGPAHDEPSPVRGELVEPPNPGTSGFWDGFM